MSAGVLLIALSDCSTSTRYRNVQNPSYGQVDFDRDWYQCKRENTHTKASVAGAYGTAEMTTDYSMAESCMRARGWQPVSQ